MKKKERKLTLRRESIRKLEAAEFDKVNGGWPSDHSCVIGSCVDCNAHETTMF